MTSGSSTMSPARMRGLSDEYGILEDHLHVAAGRPHARDEKASTSSPPKRTSPEVGSIRRSMQRPVVLLPLPDSPTRPNVSPSSMAKLTPSTALTTVPCGTARRRA